MRRILTMIALLLSITLVGTLGFRLIEGARWIDCLYMTVITLATVGFEHTIEPSDAGKVFIILLLVFGLGTFTYSALLIGQWIVNVEVRSLWERRRMEKTISHLRNHYIVCGCGRMGATICAYLSKRNEPFVVIDHDEEVLRTICTQTGWLWLVGDATDDEVLTRAGISRARSLASVLPTDADNLYVTLSARLLGPDLQIVARASDEAAVDKLQRAGATRVVSPFSSGAVRMARFMLHPSIEDFLEITDHHGSDLELADIQILAESPYVGSRLLDTDLRERGLMVIGIRRTSGESLMPPSGTAVIQEGDSLFVFGRAEAVNTLIAARID